MASASPVIRAMLETDKFKEGRAKVVEIDDEINLDINLSRHWLNAAILKA